MVKSTPPLTEDALRARYVGKLIFLRGSYLGDDLQFDMDGKVNGSPAVGSFTLSAFEVRKVKLSKHKLDIEADRYGLHFFGALPYEDDSQVLRPGKDFQEAGSHLHRTRGHRHPQGEEGKEEE